MIPDFKAYIKESVWGDMRKRAEGTEKRREDDIDLMDPDGFWEYLKKDLYEPTATYVIKFYKSPYEVIMVPISINASYNSSSVAELGLEGFNDPKGMVVTLDIRSIYRLPAGVYNKLGEMYSVKYKSETQRRQGYAKITPKDGSPVTNTFFIEVVDFLLDNIKDNYRKLVRKK